MPSDQELPRWTYLGGRSLHGTGPSPWREVGVGKFKRENMVPFGSATAIYRTRFFACAVCGAELRPLNRDYYFACTKCRLVHGWGHGGLWTYAPGHPKARLAEEVASGG